MNLRDIKKDIEYVIGAFIDDCSLFAQTTDKADDKIAELYDGAIALYNDLRDRAAVKGQKRAYFNEIRKDLLEKTDGLYSQLSEVVKSLNK